MGNLTLAGATSGQVTITPPAVAGTNTLSLPAATTTLVGQTTTDTLTNKTLTSPAISSPTISGTPVMNASVITSGTAQASTSGTSILFTGIPSWAKRITVMLSNVSTSGINAILVQIGSGSITTSGYNSAFLTAIDAVVPAVKSSSAGFILVTDTAADARTYVMQILLVGSNTYVETSTSGGLTNRVVAGSGGGSVTLSGALDRVNITTVGGTDTFDAGTINILYE